MEGYKRFNWRTNSKKTWNNKMSKMSKWYTEEWRMPAYEM
jgi:hypothetical protein